MGMHVWKFLLRMHVWTSPGAASHRRTCADTVESRSISSGSNGHIADQDHGALPSSCPKKGHGADGVALAVGRMGWGASTRAAAVQQQPPKAHHRCWHTSSNIYYSTALEYTIALICTATREGMCAALMPLQHSNKLRPSPTSACWRALRGAAVAQRPSFGV